MGSLGWPTHGSKDVKFNRREGKDKGKMEEAKGDCKPRRKEAEK